MKNFNILMKNLFITVLLFGFLGVYTAKTKENIKISKGVKIEQEKIHLKFDKNKSEPAKRLGCIDEVKIVLPKVCGLKDKVLKEKINDHLSLQSLYSISIDEIKKEILEGDNFVSEVFYKIQYLDEDLLVIEFFMETVQAYPSTAHEYRLINLKTGDLIQFNDIFKEDKLKELITLINKKKNGVEEVFIRDVKNINYKESIEHLLKTASPYTIKDLDNFIITEKSVKFLYSYLQPHAVLALEPATFFELTYEELKPFIKPDGLLGKMVNNR